MSIAVISGGEQLPILIKKKLLEEKREHIIIGFDHIKYDSFLNPIKIKFGNFNAMLKILLQNQIKFIVFAGSFKYPGLKVLLNDKMIRDFFLKYIGKFFSSPNFGLGDNTLLSTILKIFEDKGFKILSAHTILPELLISHEDIPKNILIEEEKIILDGMFGLNILDKMSEFDIGQAMIIQDKRIIAIEAAEGTKNLIDRASVYCKNGISNAILIKSSKLNQDMRIDVATIGSKTIESMIKSNIKFLFLKDKSVIGIEKEKIWNIALKNKVKISTNLNK